LVKKIHLWPDQPKLYIPEPHQKRSESFKRLLVKHK